MYFKKFNSKILFFSQLNDAKVGEDRDFSVMANVELKKFFPRKKVEE